MNIQKLELASFLREGEEYINGEEMLNRAGSAIVDYEELLKQQSEFPEEWREFYILFPKASLDVHRFRHMPYLFWDGGQWVLNFLWVGSLSFRPRDRFVRSRESLGSGKLDTPLEPFDPLKFKFSYGDKNYKVVENLMSEE